MLVVRPNRQRMLLMRESPSERSRRIVYRPRWERVVPAAVALGAAVACAVWAALAFGWPSP